METERMERKEEKLIRIEKMQTNSSDVCVCVGVAAAPSASCAFAVATADLPNPLTHAPSSRPLSMPLALIPLS